MRFFRRKNTKKVLGKTPLAKPVFKRPVRSEPSEILAMRRERKKSLFLSRFKKLEVVLRYKRLFLFLAAILLIFFIGVPLFKNVSMYKITEFEIYGNSQIPTDQISSSLESFKNKSMLEVSTDEIENKTVNDNTYINKAYARKKLPGIIEIEIVEEYPQRVLVNFSGMYVLNEANKVIKVIENTKLELNDYEYEIIKGFGDINADYVRERYLVDLEEDERSEVKWEELEVGKKQEALDKLEVEIKNIVDSYINTSFGALQNNDLGSLPVIIIYSENKYNIGENPESKKIIFTTKVITAFKKNNISFLRYEWISDYTLSVFTDDNKTILFSLIERDINDQLADLDAIIARDLISQFKIIDLRTSTFTLKNL